MGIYEIHEKAETVKLLSPLVSLDSALLHDLTAWYNEHSAVPKIIGPLFFVRRTHTISADHHLRSPGR
jgi:hypothetical protein